MSVLRKPRTLESKKGMRHHQLNFWRTTSVAMLADAGCARGWTVIAAINSGYEMVALPSTSSRSISLHSSSEKFPAHDGACVPIRTKIEWTWAPTLPNIKLTNMPALSSTSQISCTSEMAPPLDVFRNGCSCSVASTCHPCRTAWPKSHNWNKASQIMMLGCSNVDVIWWIILFQNNPK